MKKHQTSDTVVDVKDNQQIARMADWCKGNLTTEEWDYTVITMFPLWIRFRFHCPKTKVWAVLNT